MFQTHRSKLMPETTLEEAVKSFAIWRAQRKGKSKTPDHLKAMAISLLARHPISEVCKHLALNSSTLKSWGGLNKSKKGTLPTSDFVTLDPVEHVNTRSKNEISLCLSTPSGIDCKLSGSLEPNFVARLIQMLAGDNA